MQKRQRIEQQPAWILHSRPYRETSLLVDLFTPDYGRINGVLRGARQRNSPKRAYAQPFVPLRVDWSSRSTLVSLHQIEARGQPHYLQGKALISGLYLNELLVRLLHCDDAHPQIYQAYSTALHALQSTQDASSDIEPILRQFEIIFLAELGYGFEITQDYQTAQPVQADAHYRFSPGKGMTRCTLTQDNNHFLGADLITIAAQDFQQKNTRLAAKRLMRLAFQALLGGKTLKTRGFFKSTETETFLQAPSQV